AIPARLFKFMSALLTYFRADGNFCQALRPIANEKASRSRFRRNFVHLPIRSYRPTLQTTSGPWGRTPGGDEFRTVKRVRARPAGGLLWHQFPLISLTASSGWMVN